MIRSSELIMETVILERPAERDSPLNYTLKDLRRVIGELSRSVFTQTIRSSILRLSFRVIMSLKITNDY